MTSLRGSQHTVAREIEPPDVISRSLPEIGEVSEPVRNDDKGVAAARLLWTYRRFVGAVVLRGTLLFILIAFLIPKSYESTAQLMPPDQQSSGAMALLTGLSAGTSASGGSSLLGMAADLMGMQTSGQLFISVLKSETVQDRLIDRFDLRKEYWVKTYRSARKTLTSRTQIEEDRKSGVITITVMDRNRERAAALGRAYVEELNHLVAELNTGAAHRERVFLEDRLIVVKKELDQAAVDFSKFASQNSAIDIPEQGKAMVTAAAVLQGQLIAAQSELEGLSQIYTDSNVRVRSLRARVEELKRELDKVGGAASADSSSAEKGPALYPSIRQLPILGVPYADFYRRVKIDEAVYEALTKEYELARVQEAKEIPSVKVLVVPKPPERRSGPPRTLIVLGGAFLSFCLAGAWLLAREGWNNMDPEDPQKVLLQEIAGTLGESPMWKKARQFSNKFVPNRFWRFSNSQYDTNPDKDSDPS